MLLPPFFTDDFPLLILWLFGLWPKSGLWAFLAAWRTLFERFDEDKSGYISFDEYTNALVAFGYRLSPTFVNLLYCTYDKSGGNKMSFDLFVQSCIILKRMTDVFKRYDDDRDGYITLSFEEFLTGELCTSSSFFMLRQGIQFPSNKMKWAFSCESH